MRLHHWWEVTHSLWHGSYTIIQVSLIVNGNRILKEEFTLISVMYQRNMRGTVTGRTAELSAVTTF